MVVGSISRRRPGERSGERPLRSRSVDEPTFKVSELTDAVQLALDVCFPDEVWVQGEISSLKRSAAGHVYFQLIEPGPAGARPLLEVVFDDGPTGAVGTLADARERCLAALASWSGSPPAVEVSAGLDALARGAAAAQRWVGSAGA